MDGGERRDRRQEVESIFRVCSGRGQSMNIFLKRPDSRELSAGRIGA